MTHSRHEERSTPALVRIGSVAALLVVLLLSISTAARAGLASFLDGYALITNQIVPANSAISLSPNNPDAHLTRAALLDANNGPPSAVPEYEKAASLRSQDYVLWLTLARASELSGDVSRAIAAGKQAVKLAPYYAEPHWQLGNILVRAGERNEGFRELTMAAKSDSALMPGIIDLAWQLSNGNAKAVQQAVQPRTSADYQALGQYFRDHGEVNEAIVMYKSAGSEAESTAHAYVGELISAKRFAEAYSLWTASHDSSAAGTITDPGFEKESDLTEPGFGWRSTERPQACRFSLDGANPKEGQFSLRAEFSGDSDPASPVLSQMVLVQPLAHYELRFAARSENIIGGGLPVIVVIDADSKSGLGKTEQFPRMTEGWREYSIDFDTGPSTTAIQITLQREGCSSPCPIFGRIWLDGFSLRKF